MAGEANRGFPGIPINLIIPLFWLDCHKNLHFVDHWNSTYF